MPNSSAELNVDLFDLAKRYAAKAKEAFGDRLVSIALFGSVARGQAGPGSDIDLFVETAPDPSGPWGIMASSLVGNTTPGTGFVSPETNGAGGSKTGLEPSTNKANPVTIMRHGFMWWLAAVWLSGVPGLSIMSGQALRRKIKSGRMRLRVIMP